MSITGNGVRVKCFQRLPRLPDGPGYRRVVLPAVATTMTTRSGVDRLTPDLAFPSRRLAGHDVH